MNETQTHRLLNQYNQIDFLLANLSEYFLTKRHNPEKWSVHENLAHLGRYQEFFSERLERILTENEPQFGRYRAEEDAVFEIWTSKKTFEIIIGTKQARRKIAEKLMSLNESQLTRTGIHPKLGKMDISGWVEFFLLHEHHHFYTIFWWVKRYGK